jgi:L-ascorbate metabolism protein UlaG (beta-lactamase superfamily)
MSASHNPVGYIIEGSHHIYFPGDTDLFDGMISLGKGLDAALLPVWGWGPTLGSGHLNPKRAAEALTLLRPSIAIPIHWGTFYPIGTGLLKKSYLSEPPNQFAHYAAQFAPEVEVRIVRPGQHTILK